MLESGFPQAFGIVCIFKQLKTLSSVTLFSQLQQFASQRYG